VHGLEAVEGKSLQRHSNYLFFSIPETCVLRDSAHKGSYLGELHHTPMHAHVRSCCWMNAVSWL
jgi:hypothetical protein